MKAIVYNEMYFLPSERQQVENFLKPYRGKDMFGIIVPDLLGSRTVVALTPEAGDLLTDSQMRMEP